MRMNKGMSMFGAAVGAFLLMLVLSESALSIGVCRKATCPCSKEQERQGMKMIEGQCTDCAGNAKALADLRNKRMSFRAEYEKQKDLENQGRIEADNRWDDVQHELPHFSDAARGYMDLPKRVRGIGRAIQNSTPGGAYQLRSQMKAAYRDLSRMAALIKSPMDLGPLVRDLTDSVQYADQYLKASERLPSLKEDLDELDKKIEEQLKVKAKCDGKGEKKSEQKSLLEDSRMYAAGLPAFLRLVATAGSAGSPREAPCRVSQEKLSRCREASQVLRNISNFDFRETHRAFDNVDLILGRFDGDSADKMPDQEVLERAKQADQALESLAEFLDRLVSRSNEVLALLQGGGS